MIHLPNEMTVTLRSDPTRKVQVRSFRNESLPQQVAINRRLRKLIGSKASNVLWIEIILDGKFAVVEQNALLVRSFRPLSVDERSAIKLAEQLVTNAVQFRKTDPAFANDQFAYADELLWLTWTGNMRYGGDRIKHGDVRMLQFQRVASSEIRGTWNAYEPELS